MQYSQDDIFKTIQNYVCDKHGYRDVTKESNWYTDLNLTEFDKCELYEFLQNKFGIKIKQRFFSSIEVLCNMIISSMKEKEEKEIKAKNSLINKIKNWWKVKTFQNIKQ
ncbi:MAG: hypothetical protein IKN73_04595 [Alphaproteobacteria bacterium]|nr:hypothetical protein [Alphaproteobacteria bacterium]